ncbi:MAG TPA: cytochrome P460 family protein, partial [Isosphaeraceae bacterium]|nr:cytochrome P460 family protein [Isosphaeraceae bacterium]
MRFVSGTSVAAGLLIAVGCLWAYAPSSDLTAAPSDPDQKSTPAPKAVAAIRMPLPSEVGTEAFDKEFHVFLARRSYGEQGANWVHDKGVRNTGAFINGINFGTHPSVRVYYSPEVWAWLKGGREGKIPDGAMIIKEMYEPPADARHPLRDWTFMVKDSKGSFDGWYWGYYSTQPNDYAQPLKNQVGAHHYPLAGFGLYCTNCHASAASELTFITVRNVEGDPLTFDKPPDLSTPKTSATDPHSTPKGRRTAILQDPLDRADPRILALFPEIKEATNNDVAPLPGETYDHVVSSPSGPGQFLTSDQCFGCHDATRSFQSRT